MPTPARPLTLAIALAASTPAATQSVPTAQLRDALELPAPSARRAAADLLAERDVPIDDWLATLRAWRPEPHLRPGMHVVEADLWNGETLETTELHVYVPDRAAEQGPAPLLHSAHGTGGDGRHGCGMWTDVADDLGMLVVAPSESGPNDGYRFAARERAIALAALRWARVHFDVDEDRVYLTGVSRGGHMTWDVALRHPGLAAAIAPVIGGPRWNPNGQNNMRFLEHLVDVPIRDLQGLQDDPRMLLNLRLAFETLEKLGATDAELVEFPELGHSFELGAVDWRAFWTNRRTAIPERVVRVASTPGEMRAFWVEITGVDQREVDDVFVPKMPRSVHDRLDDAGQRRWIAEKAEELSARLEVTREAPGRFVAKPRHVRSFRLLLTDDMLDEVGGVEVRHGGRKTRAKPPRSAQLLLREFVERVDRRFLPVSEVEVRTRL